MEPETQKPNFESALPLIPPKKISSVSMWFLVLVIILGIVSWAYLFFHKTLVVTENQTSDWKTYRNDELGFRFKYPLNWFVSEYPNGAVNLSNVATRSELSDESLQNEADFEVLIRKNANPKKLDAETWYTEYFKYGFSSDPKSKILTKVDNKPAIRLELSEIGSRFHYYVLNNTDAIEIINMDQPKFNSTFQQILSTFKFIEPTTSNDSVSLKIGATAQLGDNLSLKLISVNDSRCPAEPNIQCVWAGTVIAKIELFKNSVSLGQSDIEINKEVSISGNIIKLLSVIPTEKKTGTQMSDYILTFSVK